VKISSSSSLIVLSKVSMVSHWIRICLMLLELKFTNILG